MTELRIAQSFSKRLWHQRKKLNSNVKNKGRMYVCMNSQAVEVSIWILNHAVGKARVVWPRSGSDILTESTTISETNPPVVVSK